MIFLILSNLMTPLIFFLSLLVVSIWGMNFVAIRLGLDGFPPLFLVFIRFFLTSIPAIFFIKRPKIPFKQVLLYGLIMFALQFSFLFIGIGLGVAPGLASLITQVQVFFTVFWGILFFNEKPNRWQLIGCIVAFTGLLVVATHSCKTISILGFFSLLGAGLFWSIGTMLAKKMKKTNLFSLVIWSSFVAWPPLLILSLSVEGYDKIYFALTHLTPLTIGSTLYITYCSTLIGYILWSHLVQKLPLATIGPFTILIPIIAMTSSILILQEPLFPWKILAACLVISGLALNLFSKKIASLLKFRP
jgi:O-acetylserine/cysteine efflux transporter